MKRLIAFILCLVMCVSVFVACGDDKPEDTQGGEIPSTTKPQGGDETTKPQGGETTKPEDDETTEPELDIERPDINLSLPEYPEEEKLADENIGAKDAGTVEDNYETIGKTPITSLDEITDPVGEYYLTADISSNDTTIEEFYGLLDGCGHTITTEVPLFGTLGGYVINLNLEGKISFTAEPVAPLANAVVDEAIIFNVKNSCDVEVKTSETAGVYAGGFAVYVYGEEVIFANCEYAGTITNVYDVKDNGRFTGGFVGSIRKNVDDEESNYPYVDFLYCTFSGSVEASSHVGGLIGEVVALAYIHLYGCLSDGEVTDTFEGSAGGLLGYMSGETSSELLVVNCANKTEVESADRAGGLVGSNTVKNDMNRIDFIWCTNNADITGVTHVAGIVGKLVGNSTFTDCVNNKNLLANLSKDNKGNPTAKTRSYMGGIVAEMTSDEQGYIFLATFENCLNYGSVDSNGVISRIGGISGHNDGVHLIFKNCVNFGDVTSHYVPVANIGAGEYRIGGIAAGGGSRYQEFYNCVNFGDVTIHSAGGAQPAGGVVGYSATCTKYFTMENCANYGDIDNSATPITIGDKTSSGSALGGLVGFLYSGAKLTFKNNIQGGTLKSSLAVADLIFWRQAEGDQWKPDTDYTVSDNYYLENAYTGDVLYGRFGVGADLVQKDKEGNIVDDDILDIKTGFTATGVSKSEIEDGTTEGLSAKMNTAAGKELFTCVKVQINSIDTKTYVVPTAILGLIAENIAQ